jgi:histidyl-tRNA synthetase
MANIPQTLKGFRDFLPADKRRRDFVASKIKVIFEQFGFEPVETPTLEYASLLLGKYGDEADKLVYQFTDRGGREVALRYDQTVPTARFLVQNQNELPTYFRRYQIQNVFRADKPQKGRYREFTQCDADVFGSTSPLADAEILAVFYQIFNSVGLTDVVIHINDRQTLLSALTPYATETVTVYSIIQSVDKLDKVDRSVVIAELIEKGLTQENADKALDAIEFATMSDNLEKITTAAFNLGIPVANLKYTSTLARGLDYYTGLIFEAKLPNATGSLGGGGRYDNLIGSLCGTSIPAVGFGLGFDRTVEAAYEAGKIPETLVSAQVLVTVFDESTSKDAAKMAAYLRQNGIATELYPAVDKLGKQFKHADQKQIPIALVIGPDEAAKQQVTIKNLKSGQQRTVKQSVLISEISRQLS